MTHRNEPPGLRLRGRAAVAQRKRRLTNEPLCRHCLAKDIVRPATVPDHITPLAFGGSDTDDNIQCLCEDCHTLKTAAEGAATDGASNHPDWLRPSTIPLTILCGPPCSGKTTYIAERASPYDTVIDLDTIARDLSPTYTLWTGQLTGQLFNQAVRVRNAMLGSLERKTNGNAWFIVSAPTKAERDWWQSKLGGQVILLHPGVEECKRRAVQRGTPRARIGIDQWELNARRPWSPPTPRRRPTGVDADGWPLDQKA